MKFSYLFNYILNTIHIFLYVRETECERHNIPPKDEKDELFYIATFFYIFIFLHIQDEIEMFPYDVIQHMTEEQDHTSPSVLSGLSERNISCSWGIVEFAGLDS